MRVADLGFEHFFDQPKGFVVDGTRATQAAIQALAELKSIFESG